MTVEEKSRYFKELALNLWHERFTVGPEDDGLLPVELEGQPLCRSMEDGGVQYLKSDVASDSRGEALEKVITITKNTAEYMGQMETAPLLTASGLTGDYRLLADFNDTVLAGHPTQYGVQFVTWEWVQNRTALYQGNYYGPSVGIDGYAAAKRDFAARSGLVEKGRFFSMEQITEIYHTVHETLESGYSLMPERERLLEGIAEQIEHTLPALGEAERPSNRQEQDLANSGPQQGMNI